MSTSKKKRAKKNRGHQTKTHQGTQAKSRLILYHGTTTLRLKEIMANNSLLKPFEQDGISFTIHRSVAEYFACNSVVGDRLFARANSAGVVLTIDGEKLLRDDYELHSYSDDYFGEGACDWEDEIRCPSDTAAHRCRAKKMGLQALRGRRPRPVPSAAVAGVGASDRRSPLGLGSKSLVRGHQYGHPEKPH